MPITITAYRCQWCNKISTLTGMKLHEQYCRANPERNCCENCVHGVTERIASGADWGEVVPYCKYHEQAIFAEPKSERPYFNECDVDYCHGEREVPVPYTCHHFKTKGAHGFVWVQKEEP